MPEQRFETLPGLPPYGPMYISIASTKYNRYREGYVVKFYKDDGTYWIANFDTGETACSGVIELNWPNILFVLANGEGYLINPNETVPVGMFGGRIFQYFVTAEHGVVCVTDVDICIVSHSGQLWESRRISWDGIFDLEINGNILSGKCYLPMSIDGEYEPFTMDLTTRTIQGGSYN